jgi:hypothetical protein
MSILAVFYAANYAWAGTDLPADSAKGSITYDGVTAELKFAATFSIKQISASPLFL